MLNPAILRSSREDLLVGPPDGALGGDVVRCGWALGSEAMMRYHDEEWGVPSHDDHHLFEMLVLEGAQAGLSWSTILNKREGYRLAFAGFDPRHVAEFDEERMLQLLQDNGIVRNRAKVRSAVVNAEAFLTLAEQHGSFAVYLWDLAGGRRIVNEPLVMSDVPARTELSDRVSKELKQKGFNFVGSTIAYSYLQSVGIVDDHLVACAFKTRS